MTPTADNAAPAPCGGPEPGHPGPGAGHDGPAPARHDDRALAAGAATAGDRTHPAVTPAAADRTHPYDPAYPPDATYPYDATLPHAPTGGGGPRADLAGDEDLRNLVQFAKEKSAGELVEFAGGLRDGVGSGTPGRAPVGDCEGALTVLEEFAEERTPHEVALLVQRLADGGQPYDVRAVLEAAARHKSPQEIVELRGLLPERAADRLVEQFTAHRRPRDVAALLRVLAGPRDGGVQDARPWADAVAHQVLALYVAAAAPSGTRAGAAPDGLRGYPVARLLMLMWHHRLDAWAQWLIEHATPARRPAEALLGLDAALEAFRPGGHALPDSMWARLEPEDFVTLLVRTWPDPGPAGAASPDRDRILGGALERRPAEVQAIHAGLSGRAPHLARPLIVRIAAAKEPRYITEFARCLPREDAAARAELLLEAAGRRTGEVLGDLVQRWKGQVRDEQGWRELLTAIAGRAAGPVIVETVRELCDHNNHDLAADLVEEAVGSPPRLTGSELADLVTLVRPPRRRVRTNRTVARYLGDAYRTRSAGAVLLVDYVQTLRGAFPEGIRDVDDAVVSIGVSRPVREYAAELGRRGEHGHERRVLDRAPD
ncbi:hypothetical protein [Streptantibioticus silvisoli]|uniref:HEAT repeat domain-containing protein n=1 Tax=Streptantibioticus silvisoli TaxID=2705255 RepID=A0ABT6VZ71_9ACTN|nr:hypothetical protein [Streptantibioticus silvisoli]MDI5963780.1 hypothetical protein [Streptantibioticus silvisoli]